MTQKMTQKMKQNLEDEAEDEDRRKTDAMYTKIGD